MIRHLALFYYHLNNDSFDYARTNWLLEIGNDFIKQEIRLLDSSSVNSYLKNIEYWRFNNKSECTNDADMIGIKNIESELRLRGFFDSNGESDGYALFFGGFVCKQNENDNGWSRWGDGRIIMDAIIEMKLYFNDLSLSFKIDNKTSIGKAHNIKKGSYRAAVGVDGDYDKCIKKTFEYPRFYS